MRHTSRLGASQRYVFLPVVVLIFSFMFGRTVRGQAPGASLPQSEQRVASPALPAAWNDGVRALAEKIVAAVTPSRTISLEVRNISSLGAGEVELVHSALETEFRSQGMKLGAADAAVTVTLAENVEGSVWVAEIRRSENDERAARIAIVAVPKVLRELAGEKKVSLTLSRNLVWRQPGPMLDFAVFYRPAGITDSTLVILEPNRLTYYRSENSEWQSWTTVAFPPAERGVRDLTGTINVAENRASIPGVRCSGDIQKPSMVECARWKDPYIGRVYIGPKVPGQNEDEGGILADRCGKHSVLLVSGDGDWTQNDVMQGYLLTDFLAEGVPSGSPIEFDGPIVAVRGDAIRGDDKDSLRVIVRNLTTGNYEGYIVTATCSQ
jgi:hypothetical protein